MNWMAGLGGMLTEGGRGLSSYASYMDEQKRREAAEAQRDEDMTFARNQAGYFRTGQEPMERRNITAMHGVPQPQLQPPPQAAPPQAATPAAPQLATAQATAPMQAPRELSSQPTQSALRPYTSQTPMENGWTFIPQASAGYQTFMAQRKVTNADAEATAQAALDRELQAQQFGHGLRMDEQEDDQSFRSGENILDRQNQLDIAQAAAGRVTSTTPPPPGSDADFRKYYDDRIEALRRPITVGMQPQQMDEDKASYQIAKEWVLSRGSVNQRVNQMIADYEARNPQGVTDPAEEGDGTSWWDSVKGIFTGGSQTPATPVGGGPTLSPPPGTQIRQDSAFDLNAALPDVTQMSDDELSRILSGGNQ